MTKRKTRSKPANPPPAEEPESAGMAPAEPVITLADLPRALRELDTPAYYNARLVGNRLEILCYGGQVLIWPADVGAGSPRPKEE